MGTTALLPVLMALASPALAGPQGGTVVAGDAAISAPDAMTTVIEQTSGRVIIDWDSFSLGRGETARFIQGSPDAVALNRVTGGALSELFGTLTADGTVFLINPAGILFGPTAEIDVHGLVATTADIANEDFMAGRYAFTIPSEVPGTGIVNQGTITVRDAGIAALVAPGVENSGLIVAELGRVALGGAQSFTLDLYGDGLITFDTGSVVAESAPDGEALVSNTGTLSADGGRVLMTARAAADVVDTVIAMDGIVEARTVRMENGAIVLDGGPSGAVSVTGAFEAAGGGVDVRGETVTLAGAQIQGDAVTLEAAETLSISTEGLATEGDNGTAALSAPRIEVDGPVDAAGQSLTLETDSLDLNASLTAPTIAVETFSPATGLSTGANALGSGQRLTLSTADLDRLVTPDLRLSAGSAPAEIGGLNLDGRPFNSLTIDGGTIGLGGTIETAGRDLIFGGPVELTNSVRIGSGGGDIRFLNTLDGREAIISSDLPLGLSIDAGAGTVLFGGPVGSQIALDETNVQARIIDSASITTLGAISFAAADAIFLGGDWNTDGGPVSLAGATTLTGDTTITAPGAAIRLPQIGAGGFDLGLNALSENGAAGTITIAALTGGGVLDISGGEDLTIAGALGAESLVVRNLLGDLELMGDTDLGRLDNAPMAGQIRFLGPETRVDAATTLRADGGTIFGTSPDALFDFANGLTVTGTPLTLQGALSAGGSGVSLEALTLAGNASMTGRDGAVINTGPINTVSTGAGLSLDADRIRTGPVTLDGDLLSRSRVETGFAGPVSADTVSADTVNAAASGGTILFTGPVTANRLAVDGPESLRLDGAVSVSDVTVTNTASLAAAEPITAQTIRLDTIGSAAFAGPVTTDTLDLQSPGAALTFAQTVTAGRLTVADADSVTFEAPVTADMVSLHSSSDSGIMLFKDRLEAQSLTVSQGPFATRFEADIQVTSPTIFQNAGGVTIGNDVGDQAVFVTGLVSTVSTTDLAGSIETEAAAITLGRTRLNTDTTISTRSADAGADVTLGAVTAASAGLIIDTGPGQARFLGSGTDIEGAVTVMAAGGTDLGADEASRLRFVGGITALDGPARVQGTVEAGGADFANTVFAGDTILRGLDEATLRLGDISALTQSMAVLSARMIEAGAVTLGPTMSTLTLEAGERATFGGPVSARELVLSGDTGRYDALGALDLGALTVSEGIFSVNLLGGGRVGAPVRFANSGGVTLGDGPTDRFSFEGGLTSTASVTTLAGTIESLDAPLSFGAGLLAADTTLSSIASAGGAGIAFNAGIDSAGASPSALTITAGPNGAVRLSGIGQMSPLAALSVTGGAIDTSSVNTIGIQTFLTRTGDSMPGPILVAGAFLSAGGDIILDGRVSVQGGSLTANTKQAGAKTGAVTLGAAETGLLFEDADAPLSVTAGDGVTLARLGSADGFAGPGPVSVTAGGSILSAGGTVNGDLTFAAGSLHGDPAARAGQSITLADDLTVNGLGRFTATGDLALDATLAVTVLEILIDGTALTGEEASLIIDDTFTIGSLTDGGAPISDLIGSIRGIDTSDAAGFARQTGFPLNQDLLFNGCVVGVRCGQDDRVITGINVFALTVEPVEDDEEAADERFSDLGNFELYRSLGLDRSWIDEEEQEADDDSTQ